MPKHTDRSYAKELADLREVLMGMAGLCEVMLTEAMDAVECSDADVARAAIARDKEVDRLELEVDRAAMALLARRQPVAADLRFIVSAMKLVTDLERVGDLVSDICWVVVDLPEGPGDNSGLVERILAMFRMVRSNLRDALDAFVRKDADRALELLPRDNEVNQANDRIHRKAFQAAMASPQDAERLYRFLSISRHLERIGDHAKNIAESAIFLAEARDVRHGGGGD